MTCFFPAAQRGLVRMRRRPVCPAVPTVPVPEKTLRSRTTGCGAIQKSQGHCPCEPALRFSLPRRCTRPQCKIFLHTSGPVLSCKQSEREAHLSGPAGKLPRTAPARTRCCRNITNISFPQPVHSARAHRVTGPDTTANVLAAVVFSSRPMSGAAACCGKKPCGQSHNAMKSTPKPCLAQNTACAGIAQKTDRQIKDITMRADRSQPANTRPGPSII